MFDPQTIAVRVFNHQLVARPLSATAFAVLAKVHAAEGIAQCALARALRLTPPSLSRILARLGRAGLVRQVPSPTDRRFRFVRLTPIGRQGMDVVQATIVRWETG